MTKRIRFGVLCIMTLIVLPLSVTLLADVNAAFPANNKTLGANIAFSSSPTYQVSIAPARTQEGLNTTLTVNVQAANSTAYTFKLNVTDPSGLYHAANVSLVTNATGFGTSSAKYWGNFTGANTNLVGTYGVLLQNATQDLATANFIVGLTDRIQYRRGDTVLIQAAGYKPSEVVTANIKIGGISVADFPNNFTATSSGLVTLSWAVPVNATSGTYSLTVSNTTSGGTVKGPADVQNFEVLGALCLVQTKNLEGEAVSSVVVEAYNASNPKVVLMTGNTNSSGWIRFNLDYGNYTFKAFVRNVEVAKLNQSVTENLVLLLPLRLVNLVAKVTFQAGGGVPLADISLKYNYTTRLNTTLVGSVPMQTNLTGIAMASNLFTDRTYSVLAERNGLVFSNTTLNMGSASPVLLDLVVPSYILNVHTLDAKASNATGVQLQVYEWGAGTSQPFKSNETGTSGDASFFLPVGKYVLKASEGTIFLSQVAVDVSESSAFTFNLNTLNVDAVVSTRDLFGQPIANVEVIMERKMDSGYVLVDSGFTGTGGSIVFESIVGGDCRISVYVSGKLAAVQTQFLGTGSNNVAFRMGSYVAVLGFPFDSGLFALFSFVVVLLIVILVLTRQRWLHAFRRTRKE